MTPAPDHAARSSCFIVRESAHFKRFSLTANWQIESYSNIDDLLQSLRKTASLKKRTILIVSEVDFSTTYLAIEQKLATTPHPWLGILVVIKEGSTFLQEKGHVPYLLDVVPEKDFERDPTFHCLRVLRLQKQAQVFDKERLDQNTLEMLNQIFITLSAERDPQSLLSSIVKKATELSRASAGLLYMVQEQEGEIFFKYRVSLRSDGMVDMQSITLKTVENSLAGYVALTGRTTNIEDVSTLRPLTVPQYMRSTDAVMGNGVVSIITLPLKNSRHELVAVLQLANKISSDGPDRKIVRFEVEGESLLQSFATQAAICLENVDLYADIRRLFEGFVYASITAIESRDPSTGGHSERVAKMSVALARATSDCNAGIYRGVKFKEEEIRELEYAALLHDFGKIGVREEVLVKAKKLYAYQLDAIRDRIKICKAAAKITYLEKKLSRGGDDPRWAREYEQRLAEIESYWHIIVSANEPSILRSENREILNKIRSEQLLLPDGSRITVLTEEEYIALSIPKGTLTESERMEIESHVRHTYQFLKMIPWTRDFRGLTEIAYCHHEKLDGSGYPRRLKSSEIPLQSKIMTVADIYDALTAADRWYKEAVPSERALNILESEVRQGKLDPILFGLFVERRIYELPLEQELLRVA